MWGFTVVCHAQRAEDKCEDGTLCFREDNGSFPEASNTASGLKVAQHVFRTSREDVCAMQGNSHT